MNSKRTRRGPDRNGPLSRLGETDSKTVIWIILAAVGGLFVIGCIPCLIALLLPAVQQAREAARRTQSRNHLHNIGLAMHNFHDVEGRWVSGGTTGPDGELVHSWQTHLLPYMDQTGLYQQVDLEVAWDDPSHVATFQTIIPKYHNPSETVLYTASGYATSHYAGNQNVLLTDSELTMRDIVDGTSNTVVAGEVANGFQAWGDPTNLRDPANGIGPGTDQFGRSGGMGAHMLFLDGSVRFISEDIDPAVLEALSTYDGGERVGAF